MSARRIALQAMVIAMASGFGGFWLGYASIKSDTQELVEMFAEVPTVKVADLGYAFATPAHVKALIDGEQSWPGDVRDREAKVTVFRLLRLAVVAPNVEAREALVAEALAACKTCKPESLRGMLQRYAQRRLVPPGDEIACETCKPGRVRRPLPPVERVDSR